MKPELQVPSLKRHPLHRQVADLLRDDILGRLTPGDRLEAESALAKRLGVSLLTVREALSALAQEGLVSREHGRGTFVAKPVNDRHIAILSELDLTQRHISAYFLRVAAHLPMILAKEGLESRLYIGHTPMGGPTPEVPTCPQFMEAVSANRVAGVAVLTMKPSDAWLDPVRRRQIPVVAADACYENGVRIDYADMVRQGVNYLVESGCRRPVMLAYGPQLVNELGDNLFLQAARAAGMDPLKPRPVFSFAPGKPDTPGSVFADLWRQPASKRPDGLLVLDDIIFQGLLSAFLFHRVELARTLRVVTHLNRGAFDLGDMPVARLEVDPEAVAEAQAALLVRRLRNPQAPREVVTLKAELCRPTRAAAAA